MLSPADLRRLKAATKDLIDLVDGIERAARLTSRSKSQVARWYAARDDKNPDEPCLATIDAASVALLERDLADRGEPRRPVTEVLAGFAGRSLGDAGIERARRDVASAAARFSGEVGGLITHLVEALGDGIVTETESALGDARARTVSQALEDLRMALAATGARRDL